MVADHEIFNKPFKVNLTLAKTDTPDGYRKWYEGKDLPAQLDTWRVQTKLKKQNYGLVSDPYGLEDSPDSEWISGGLNSKGPRSAALARQGNWFLWGFCADPTEMTEEAKLVYLNTIVYMKRFDGRAPLFQREDSGREWALTRAQWLPQDYAKNSFSTALLEASDGDAAKMTAILEKSLPYLHRVEKKFAVDEDCQALGLSNRDVALLERCVALLEEGKDVERARRLLMRYTGLKHSKAAQWREWLAEHRDRLFFTDTGGYRFRTHDLPRNVVPARFREPGGKGPG